MIVYVRFNPVKDFWFYYTIDSKGHKTKTEGFKIHMDAISHLEEKFVDKEYEIKYY